MLVPSGATVVGYALSRWFNHPLDFDASLPRTIGIHAAILPEPIAQFQEVFDLVLETLPPVDWIRCKAGDAQIILMVRQVLEAPTPLQEDHLKPPSGDDDIVNDLIHYDEYWPGASYFVISDGPLGTMFYPDGRDGLTYTFPPRTLVKYDASLLHSAPGFSAAGRHSTDVLERGRRRVLRTFLRILAWDPHWLAKSWSHMVPLLRESPQQEWERPQVCAAEDIIRGCFDGEYSCERCCDLSKGPMGDSLCWAGWMTYQKCCGPASRRWSGCGWRRGVDYWAHEYYSLTPPKLHSPAQCQQRCAEDPYCGGWTHFPEDWRPIGCRLPLAGVMSMRRSCLLRGGADENPQTPHRGLLWGPRECPENVGGCLKKDIDHVSWELEIARDVANPAACRKICQCKEQCQAFVYFPADYLGEPDDRCILPQASHAFWKARCLLKSHLVAEDSKWFLPLGNVVSGSRSCPSAAPWREGLEKKVELGLDFTADDRHSALDGDLSRRSCSRTNPWQITFDTEYEVREVILWLGDLEVQEPTTYFVFLSIQRDGRKQEVPCGNVTSNTKGRPVRVACPTSTGGATGIIVSSPKDGLGSFALCEVEPRIEPVACKDLIPTSLIIGALERRVFPKGLAKRTDLGTMAGRACERYGGGIVTFQAPGGERSSCVEALCVPSACLEVYDDHAEDFDAISGRGVWDSELEAAEVRCTELSGRFYESAVKLLEGDDESQPKVVATLHASLCAPSVCGEDVDAVATVALRIFAMRGIILENLPSNIQVSIQNVRPFARWEDVDLDFLIGGFARSGTHSLQGNLMKHTQCEVPRKELTFNWGPLPMQHQLQQYEGFFRQRSEEPRLFRGGKGEGVAFSPRLLRHLWRVPGLKIVIVIREPTEWLESLYNLRAYGCREDNHCGDSYPTLEDVILKDETLEDVRLEYVEFSKSLKEAVKQFPPSSKRLLLVEFELLKQDPRTFYDRVCDFLGIDRFPTNYSFKAHSTEERKAYTAAGKKADLCQHPEALEKVRAFLRERQEHQHIAKLLAQSGAPWVSRRLLLGEDHCP